MGLTTVPRDIARLEYSVVRLPLTLLEERVVAKYWDEEAILRLGFETFLGSLDGLAGRLLADDDLSRRGQALLMRTEYLVNANELNAQAQLRRMRADEELQAERAAARRARDQATAEMDAKVAAAHRKEQQEQRKARRTAAAEATVKKARAQQAAGKRAARAAETKQAEQKRARRSSTSGSPGRGSGSPGRGSGSPGRGSGSPGRGSGSSARGGQPRRAASS